MLTDSSGFLNDPFPIIPFCELQTAKRPRGGTSMSYGPKGSEEPSNLSCCVCGRVEELFELPGRVEKYCLECSADVATSILLATEIDVAKTAGQDTDGLIVEFAALGNRMMEEAQ